MKLANMEFVSLSLKKLAIYICDATSDNNKAVTVLIQFVIASFIWQVLTLLLKAVIRKFSA